MALLRIGILGAAGIAPRSIIAPARRRSDVLVVAVASLRPNAARAYAAEHGIARAHESYEALINDPGIDLVYNALHPAAHARWSIAALGAGKHVLCEKPIAMNSGEALAMHAAATRNKRRLIEAFHDRYHPLTLHLLSLRDTGKLGALRAARADFAVDIPYEPRSIRHDPKLGGGAMMDLGCYPVHWLRTLFGSEPQVLQAAGERNPLGADLRMRATLQFPSGATAELMVDMAGGPMKAALHVESTRGTLSVLNPVLPHLGHSVSCSMGPVSRQYTVAGATSFDHQLEAVIDGLARHEPLPTEGADSIANMTAIEKIYVAAGFDIPGS